MIGGLWNVSLDSASRCSGATGLVSVHHVLPLLRLSRCSTMATPSGEANSRLVKKSRYPSGLLPGVGSTASVVLQSGTRRSVSRPSGGRAAHRARAPCPVCIADERTDRNSTARTKQCSAHVFNSLAVSGSIRKNAGIADRYRTFSAMVIGMIPSQMNLRAQLPASDQ